MEAKLNIANILKDKPNGTKLYADAFGELKLVKVDEVDTIYTKNKTSTLYSFYNDGKYDKNGELSKERKDEIERIAKENDCEIINILDKNSPFYVCGPSEFLYLEKHAFLICTDSFHSSVFAILYNRPFVIFDREDKEENMGSRLDTLINKFKFQIYHQLNHLKKILNMNYH